MMNIKSSSKIFIVVIWLAKHGKNIPPPFYEHISKIMRYTVSNIDW